MGGCRFVTLGLETPAGAAFAASGCSSILDFLSSPLLRDAAPTRVLLSDRTREREHHDKKTLLISVRETRDREEAREAGSFVRFLHALPSSLPPSCSSLHILHVNLISMEELSALCSGIASPLCTLSRLSLDFHCIEPQAITDVAQSTARYLLKDALSNNTSLTYLSLVFSENSPISSAQGCLIPALTRPPPCASSIKHLVLRYENVFDSALFDAEVSEILQGLACNTISLTHFEVYSIYPSRILRSLHFQVSLQSLGTMLHTNTSLQTLRLYNLYLPGDVVKMLFASLEQNAHLTSLSLQSCYGPGWPSGSFVLDSLRVNGIVTSLDLYRTPLEYKSKAAIYVQLARNKQRAEQLKVEGSALVPPNTVRLFLCGLPFSGKTTLSRSLVKWNTGTFNHARCLPLTPALVLERTRGIEVSALEKDGVKVSLWDMAGQEQYYAFHGYMFPNLSDDTTPSLFLFVWNPMLLDKETNKEIKDRHGKSRIKTPDMFEHEFRYWLRFIASKTLKSLKFRPNLFVAVTRADRLPIQAKTWITSSFEKCQNDFQEHIQCDMEGVFEIDARDPSHVKGLGLCILERATSILKVKPAIYQACNHARIVLAELVLGKRLAPVITKEEFFHVCKKHLGLDGEEMQEAVALSLHEFGDLIYFKELELVVIDTRWFCHELMGNLLYSFTDMEHQQYRGFFPVKYLESLLESRAKPTNSGANQFKAYRTIFAKRPTISPTVKGKDLVKLLMGLQLACQQDDGNVDSDVFIPASLCTISRKRIDPSMFLKGEDDKNIRTFLGRRLKCKDSICTFFTPGIFTPLQVAFNGTFNRTISLDEGVIAFSQSGVKVFIEFCKHEGRDHFIDVLIHSRLDLDNTIAWAYEKVLDKMESICAQPRGIQGVELVHEVIRPRSVQEFVCMEERSIYTAVSLEELRKTLRDALEKRGPIDQRDCLNTVFHDWYPTNDSDCVIDLLGNVETLQVVKEHTHKFILDVENVLGINIEEGLVCSTSEPEKKEFSSTNSGKERKWIHDKLCEVHTDIQKIGQELDELHRISKSVLPQICQSVQELLTFAKEGEAGKLPRLFVVTKDNAGMVREIVGAMVPGLQNVRLELLCEHQAGPHLVTNQRGIRFSTLEDGLLKQGLPYINMFLKLASMAVKVAAHVTSGLGNVMPDFSHVLAMIVDTPEFPSLPAQLDFQAPSASRANFQDSQRWLFGVLSERNCVTSTRIHEVFGLYRVRCRDSHVRWLCDKHCSQGELCP